MKVAIIILHFGSISVTSNCVESIRNTQQKVYEIIMVNNDRIPLTKAMFGRGNEITIINNKKNLGFAAGVNVGIRYCLKQKFDYVMLLNNDTHLDKAVLVPLVMFLQAHPEVGIVGPAIEFYKNNEKIYDLGGNLNAVFGRTNHTEVKEIINTTPRITTYITGACMMVKTDVIEKVGPFDEQFFLYYEDVDFCLRAKQRGFASYVLPSVVISHSLSKSVGKVSPLAIYHQTKSAVLFGKKYCRRTRIFNLLFILAQSVLFVLKKGETGLVTFQAMKDASFRAKLN